MTFTSLALCAEDSRAMTIPKKFAKENRNRSHKQSTQRRVVKINALVDKRVYTFLGCDLLIPRKYNITKRTKLITCRKALNYIQGHGVVDKRMHLSPSQTTKQGLSPYCITVTWRDMYCWAS